MPNILTCTVACAAAIAAANGAIAQGTKHNPGSPSTNVPESARAFLADYATFAHSVYARSTELAVGLAGSVEALAKKPSAATLEAARAAWLAAREVYVTSEVLRFYGGPIDSRADGLEIFINAWPIDESYIDAVATRPRDGMVGGIVGDVKSFPILDPVVLRVANQRGGETNVCLDWHAVEFLLWGQDLDPAGPGRRSFEDFDPGSRSEGARSAARRNEYLRVVCAALVQDLTTVRDAWAPDRDNFRRRFLAGPPEESLRDALRGMLVLSGFELAGERLAVAYETRDQEQEHSCFSDNTHRDLINNQRGILSLWRGDLEAGAGMKSGGLRTVAAAVDAPLAADLDRRMEASLRALQAIPAPFDQAILGEDDAPGRRAVLAAIEALETQTEALAALGLDFGFVIPVKPGA